MKITKKIKKEYLREKLGTDKRWAIRALMLVYSYQTIGEKVMHQTVEYNGVGFSGCDAELLTSFAKQWEKRKFLSDKQMKYLFKKIKKYWEQVLSACDINKLEKLCEPYAEQKKLEKERAKKEMVQAELL